MSLNFIIFDLIIALKCACHRTLAGLDHMAFFEDQMIGKNSIRSVYCIPHKFAHRKVQLIWAHTELYYKFRLHLKIYRHLQNWGHTLIYVVDFR